MHATARLASRTWTSLADVRAVRARRPSSTLGGSERAAEDLVQAVDEATCNVMLHGYGGEPGAIEIEAALRDGSIEIRILDRAPLVRPDGRARDRTRRTAARARTARRAWAWASTCCER